MFWQKIVGMLEMHKSQSQLEAQRVNDLEYVCLKTVVEIRA